MPLPPAIAARCFDAPGSSRGPKLPVGVITSSSSPTLSFSAAYDENAPSGMRLIPIRSLPLVADEQIE